MENVRTDKTIAIEILKQLGGNRFIAMTGAKNFTCDNNSMGFQISNRNKLKARFVKISLNVMDTYDIQFKTIKKNEVITLDKISGIYNDQLQEIFTDRTGLQTHL
jgi:hypothetical protein